MDHDRQQASQATVPSLHERLAACETALSELRSGALSVRRLSICDDRGIERAAIEITDRSTVFRLRTTEPGPNCVEMFAHDSDDGEGPHVGVAVTRAGEVIGEFGFVGDAVPRLWLESAREDA